MSSPNERNWRGIFIALLVIVAVLGLIVFSIVLVSPPEEGPRVKGRKPTLEDIFLKLPPEPRFNGTWISGNNYLLVINLQCATSLLRQSQFSLMNQPQTFLFVTTKIELL